MLVRRAFLCTYWLIKKKSVGRFSTISSAEPSTMEQAEEQREEKPQEQLTFMSWNVDGLDSLYREARFDAVLELISRLLYLVMNMKNPK